MHQLEIAETAGLISINVGRARVSTFKGKEAVSGIFKNPVAGGEAAVGHLGLEGDEQADTVNHGGPDKAVCVYSRDHYPHWEEVLGRELALGAFGENFTLQGWTEGQVSIGDVFRVGTVVVQISQPRVPCWKLAMKWGMDRLPEQVAKSGATGYYYRVLQPGAARAGQPLIRESEHPAGVTVAEANRIMHRDKDDLEGLRRLIGLDVLAESWKQSLAKRLDRLQAGG